MNFAQRIIIKKFRLSLILLLLVMTAQVTHAQKKGQALIDSLLTELPKAKEDTNKVKIFVNLSLNYVSDPDEGIRQGEQGLALTEKLGWKPGIATACNALAWNHLDKNNYAKAQELFGRALQIYEESGNTVNIAKNLSGLGDAYNFSGDQSKALEYYQKSLTLYQALKNKKRVAGLTLAIGNSYNSLSNYPMALAYYLKALQVNEEIDDKSGIAYTLGDLGNNYFSLKDYQKALEYYQKSLQLNETIGVKTGAANNLGAIGMVYSAIGNHAKALEYKMKALRSFEELGYKMGIANNLGNIGNEYAYLGDYSKALQYHQKSLQLNEELDYKAGVANNLGDIGEMYKQAVENNSFTFDSLKLTRSSALKVAEEYLNKSNELLKKIGELSKLESNLNTLSKVRQLQGNDAAALETYREHVLYKDSIFNDKNRKELARRELQYEYGKHEDSLKYQQLLTEEQLHQQTLLATQQRQALLLNQQQFTLLGKEKDLQELSIQKTEAELYAEQNKRQANEQQLKATQKEQALVQTTLKLQTVRLKAKQSQSFYLIGGIIALLIVSFFISRNYLNQRKSNQLLAAANTQITTERDRSDKLLLNILPADVAEELKEKGSADARLFDHVTVLFTDFVNFTTISELLTPQQLVDELHYCFKAFDDIISKYGIEKIKTIGDAYLAVAGLPNDDAHHAANTVKAALEIRQFVRDRKEKQPSKTFEIRIGIHSGSVVAGIVGVKKFAYDIWGDTVNTAARMEQHSLPGQINLSEKTYEMVQDQFAFTYRGEIEAKNKGALKMYFVEKKSVAMPVSN